MFNFPCEWWYGFNHEALSVTRRQLNNVLQRPNMILLWIKSDHCWSLSRLSSFLLNFFNLLNGIQGTIRLDELLQLWLIHLFGSNFAWNSISNSIWKLQFALSLLILQMIQKFYFSYISIATTSKILSSWWTLFHCHFSPFNLHLSNHSRLPSRFYRRSTQSLQFLFRRMYRLTSDGFHLAISSLRLIQIVHQTRSNPFVTRHRGLPRGWSDEIGSQLGTSSLLHGRVNSFVLLFERLRSCWLGAVESCMLRRQSGSRNSLIFWSFSYVRSWFLI